MSSGAEPDERYIVVGRITGVFGVKGWQVRPLGDMTEGSCHHHLLINAVAIEQGKLIPVDQPERYIHFGKGQTETTLKLAPGTYKLQLQLGDGAHNSLGKDAQAMIQVTVK